MGPECLLVALWHVDGIGIFVVFAAMLAAAYFLKPVGIERWALLGLAAFGGVLITYGAIHEPLRKQYEVLHEFIDFDRVRAKLEGR